MQQNNNLYVTGFRDFFESWYDFSYLNDQAFADSFLGTAPQENVIGSSFNPSRRRKRSLTGSSQCLNLPTYKNWAEERKLSSIQNQRLCACSYLLSAVGILESYAAIKNNIALKKLSIQNTLECVKEIPGINLRGQGCNGGRPEWIWKYSREKQGLVADDVYNKPYNTNPSGVCQSNLARESNTEIDHWIQIPAGDEEEIKCHLANVGPLVVDMTVGFTSFRSYKGGVWNDPENNCTARQIDHVSAKS